MKLPSIICKIYLYISSRTLFFQRMGFGETSMAERCYLEMERKGLGKHEGAEL